MSNPSGTPKKRHIEHVKIEPKIKRRRSPGSTIESRENQLISLAYDLIEERFRKGTATSQEVTTFIKMGSTIAQLEKAKLEHENQLLRAKAEALQSHKIIEELYSNALAAMRTYSGKEEL